MRYAKHEHEHTMQYTILCVLDGIFRACTSAVDSTHGGFQIDFTTVLGSIPLLTVVNSTQSSSVTVAQVADGTKLYQECSGESGYCDRFTGIH